MSNTHELARGLARELRKHQTKAEKILWHELRNRKFHGKKFLRQHPLFFDFEGNKVFFVPDFYCHENRLVIEVDGKSHKYQKEYDQYRTYLINKRGVRVVRFKNEEIENRTDEVLRELERLMGT